jgi:hypothetical protein
MQNKGIVSHAFSQAVEALLNHSDELASKAISYPAQYSRVEVFLVAANYLEILGIKAINEAPDPSCHDQLDLPLSLEKSHDIYKKG